MSEDFGIEKPGAHHASPHREPARYLVVIETGGSALARLFLKSRVQVAEFDAGTEEVAAMTEGLEPTADAIDPAWDRALEGHSRDERAAAQVYTLSL